MFSVVDEFIQAQPIDGDIIDLGSGWGSLVLAIARQYPQHQCIGYELSILPWLMSVAQKTLLGLDNLTLHRKDFLQADLSQASVLLCYLYPDGMRKLKDKLSGGKGNAALIVSNTFALPNIEPQKTIRLKDLYTSPVYVYRN